MGEQLGVAEAYFYKYSLINLIFSILSIAFISGIFLLADSSMVSDLSSFNPYSLLHIPLYGVLTGLLAFSILPLKFKCQKHYKERNFSMKFNVPNHSDASNILNHLKVFRLYALTHLRIFGLTYLRRDTLFRLLTPGLVAFGVAVADEIHQAYIPNRNASINDVFLDLTGIGLGMLLILQIYKKKFNPSTA